MITLRMEGGQARLQRAFAEAILRDDRPVPATIRSASGTAYASRFGVYRNNVLAGLIGALAARYPVTRTLLWDDAFNHVARLYITAEPPHSPVMFEYGGSFPQFLRNIGQSVASDYLADVAELEAARTLAYHAADAAPLPCSALGAISQEDLPNLRLALHPSAILLKSRFPVVSIWEASRSENDNMIDGWKPECALIARPYLQTEVRALSAGVHAFMTALTKGCTLGQAIARTAEAHCNFDLGECFDALISTGIVVGLELSEARTDAHIVLS